MSDQSELRLGRKTSLKNVICAYCGTLFGPTVPAEIEHVVGLKFVPRGTLVRSWHLTLNACGPCNDVKAELENDISAITMMPDGRGRHACDDRRLVAEAQRKSTARSNRTNRYVPEPEPPIEIVGRFGSARIGMNFVGPPQVTQRRLFELAHFHLAGFFSMLTFQEERKHGWYWPGVYWPVVATRKEDWGNPHLRWIEETARDWEGRLHAQIAEDFYKVWIRKMPAEPPVWAWAMEWNRNFRLAGLFGDQQGIEGLAEALPKLRKLDLGSSGEGIDKVRIRFREEVPLPDEEDRLFEQRGFISNT